MNTEQEDKRTKSTNLLINFEKIKNKTLKRILEHSIYLLILLVLIPSYLYFEICVVLPTLIELWSISYFVHLFLATFELMNVVGNMVYGMTTNTSIKGKVLLSDQAGLDWSLCSICEALRPPRAWHCDMCNTCILKRDHHCTFLATCVGYHNQRYFMLFMLHICISMIYAFYYNIQFAHQYIPWNNGFVIIKFIFPLACFAFDFGVETLYIFLIVINIIAAAFTGFLFIYHLKNILKGRTTPEMKHSVNNSLYDYGWRLNLIEVFGSRWYLTWVFPSVASPLPGDGISWVEVHKQK